MKRFAALILLFFTLAAIPASGADRRVPVWETVVLRDEPNAGDNEPIEVSTKDHQIYITTSRPVEISVYTILGQLITRRKITPGTVRLTLGSRGVYILKTDTATLRINL